MTVKKTRSPMKNPTKKQVTDRLNHFENGLKALLNLAQDSSDTGYNLTVASAVQDILDGAPSLAVTVNTPPADASEDLAEGESLVEVEIVVGEEAAE